MAMRIHWWQSIRWRLMVGSVLLALLATTLLALTAIIVVNNNYGVEQRNNLGTFANQIARRIRANYEEDQQHILANAVQKVLNDPYETYNGQKPIILILSKDIRPIYPNFNPQVGTSSGTVPQTTATAAATPTVQGTAETATATNRVLANNARIKKEIQSVLELIEPASPAADYPEFAYAIQQARLGKASTGKLGSNSSPLGNPQPFAVSPIYGHPHVYGKGTPPVIGILVVSAHTETIAPFVSTVSITVFIASLIVAILAALIAIIFSQTITRPLVRLTDATRVLASGDYSAQVTTQAPGELGELSSNFNHMATQLKRDVEELRQQEAWRRELIMNITHDLATPLTAIAGLGESLTDGVNQSREDYEATGRIIMQETLRLRRLVQDLHVMAKVEAGAFHPDVKPLRLAALVDEVMAVLAPEFERHQVEPRNDISYSLPMVMADGDMLKRIFSNICNNSLRHTPAGGHVTINAIIAGSMMRVTCVDTGEGIPEEALPRVFERFYRGDSARQSATGGSGLGLAIVRAIVEAHGGQVWAENVPGAGACIAFTLPVQEVPLPESPTAPLPLKGTRNTRLVKMVEQQSSSPSD